MYFYVNPLASDGRHHREPFFDCACCPPNAARFLASLPGYVYSTDKTGIYVNLYIAGTAKVPLGDNSVTLTQESRYPWDSSVRLKVEPKTPAEFTISLRIPGWCNVDECAINGEPVLPSDMRKGYVRMTRKWQSGDAIELDLPMPVERIEANPRVQADRGRVAIQRGPIVYCFEAVDNGGHAKDIVLARDAKFVVEHRKDLLGGVTVITGVAADGRKITAVPYYAWDHRAPGEMIVWPRQEGKPTEAKADDPAWKDKLYRPLDPTSLR